MTAHLSSAKPTKAADTRGNLTAQGFRVAASRPHTSKILMLHELNTLLAAVPADAPATAYRAVIVEENALGKRTLSAQKETGPRLTALHGLDPTKSLFRILLRLLDMDPTAYPPAGVTQRSGMQASSACPRLNRLRASSTSCAIHPILSQQHWESRCVWDLPPASAVKPTSEEEGLDSEP